MLALFVLANLGIFMGYVFAATAVAPRLRVRLKRTRWGGVVFFATCGLTHLELALHAAGQLGITASEMTSWHMVLIHGIQVVAVWAFLTGMYRELTYDGLAGIVVQQKNEVQ